MGFIAIIAMVILIIFTYSNRISRRIERHEQSRPKTKEEIAHEIMEQELEKKRSQSPKWKCHRCGRSNPMYQTTCYCGQSKDQ